MKTLPALLILALLLSAAAAWLLPQEVSRATTRTAAEEPLTIQTSSITIRAAAPVKMPPPSPRTLVVKPVSEKQRALQAAFDNDELCESSKLLSEASSEEMYGAVLASISPSGELEETYGRDGPMLADRIDTSRRYKSRAARTAWAFKVGGLGYFPVSAPGSDLAAARALLLDLEKREPLNAFYPLFRLVLESRLGYANDKLKVTAEAAAAGSALESPLRLIEEELDEASWRNASLRHARTDYQSIVNPPYHEAAQILERLEKDASFTGKAHIADLLAEEAQQASRGPQEGGFEISRYHAAVRIEPRHLDELETLMSRRGWKFDYAWPSLYRYESSRSICEPAPYQEYFAGARGRR